MKDRLTKSQSERLIELGIPKEKASVKHIELTLEEYRVFSLVDLLSILPKEVDITLSDGSINHAYLKILGYGDEWNASYEHYEPHQGAYTSKHKELIDCIYGLLEDGIKYKFIKTEEG